MVRTTGEEFKRFYNDSEFWPASGDIYHDDETIEVNGQEYSEDFLNIPDDASVRIIGGAVFGHCDDDLSFESYFRRWRKKQSTVSILVTCDKNVADTVIKAVEEAGGKVVK